MNSLKKHGLQCVVLCGGKGERLRPLTADIPKPLVKVNGKPILSHILSHMMNAPIDEFILCTGYKWEKIDAFISENRYIKPVRTIHSGDVDIVQRLAGLEHIIKDDFIVLYGDTISDINIVDLINFHRHKVGKATVSVWPLKSEFGVMDINDSGKVTGYFEKPVLNKWINIGYFYFERGIVQKFKEFSKYEDFLRNLMLSDQLNAFKHNGIHITINSLRDLEAAEMTLNQIGERN